MIGEVRRSLAKPIARLPARLLAKSGVSPNALTIFGFLIALVIAPLLATGHLFLSGFLVLLSGAFDLLDGTVARLKGESTVFGALLDSTLDRFAEAALFIGLLAYYANRPGSLQEIILVAAALVGSMMTSYIRARSEGLALKCEVGIFTRPERVVLLAIGLIFNELLVVLWIIAILATLTAWQRLFHIWRQTNKQGQGQ